MKVRRVTKSKVHHPKKKKEKVGSCWVREDPTNEKVGAYKPNPSALVEIERK